MDNIGADSDDLPVLQTPVKIEEVSNASLVQAQETCVLLHQMILSNQDLATNELVLSVVQQLQVSQNNIMTILNTTNNEADMAQALAVNDLIVQILFGYEEVAAGRMRREGPDKEGEESEQAAEDAPLFPDLGDAAVSYHAGQKLDPKFCENHHFLCQSIESKIFFSLCQENIF